MTILTSDFILISSPSPVAIADGNFEVAYVSDNTAASLGLAGIERWADYETTDLEAWSKIARSWRSKMSTGALPLTAKSSDGGAAIRTSGRSSTKSI
jgi:hypothetical protein